MVEFESRYAASLLPPAITVNAEGRSPFVLVCDHASNRIPDPYGDLGLSAIDRLRHIAWDPGALAVSRQMMDLLDAPLVQSTVSRLVIDTNRFHDAPDLINPLSETTEIPANQEIGDHERANRIALFHDPFHTAIDTLMAQREAAGLTSVLVAVHSFTPVYKGVARPWSIGLIHGQNETFTRALYEELAREAPDLNIGWNEPYAARNGVTYTLEHHGDGRGLQSTMIEIANTEILEPSGVRLWASRLARCVASAREKLAPTSESEF